MPIEVLAATVVSQFLLPALKTGGEKIVEAIAGEVSQQAADHTEGLIGGLWAKVNGLFRGGSEREERTLADFKEDPDTYADAVTKILDRKLQEDQAAAEEIQRLIDAPVPGTTMTGVQVFDAGVVGIVDARQANFSGASSFVITGVTTTASESGGRHPKRPPDVRPGSPE
jgi:hypothetical protein